MTWPCGDPTCEREDCQPFDLEKAREPLPRLAEIVQRYHLVPIDPSRDLVAVALPREDVDFIRKFHPDRDRTATRADLVRVIEHLQAALNDTEEKP